MISYLVNDLVLIFGPDGAMFVDTATPSVAQYRAIVSLGESNADGLGVNAELSPALLAPTSRVKILITSSGQFEDLDIGTNNNLAHAGLSSVEHGWEAGLVPYMDANPGAQLEPMYLIQCGQGGSRVTQWANGGAYWTAAQTRINQAKAVFATLGIQPVWDIWFTLGINDVASGELTPAQYKAGCVTLLNEVRAMIGNGTGTRVRSPMFFDSMRVFASEYLAAHESIGDDLPNYQIVAAADLPNDGTHWSSAGQVALGQRMASLSTPPP